MDEINLDNAILYADSSLGVYVPRYFATSIRKSCLSGIDPTDLDLLINKPIDWEWYWDTWASVLDNAIVTVSETGVEYGLYQDGDLWLVPLKDLKG